MPRINVGLNLGRYSIHQFEFEYFIKLFKQFLQWFYWIEDINMILLQKELTK
jgi:hypothetical protein